MGPDGILERLITLSFMPLVSYGATRQFVRLNVEQARLRAIQRRLTGWAGPSSGTPTSSLAALKET